MSVTFIEEYRTADKSDWGDGPWTNEPDKAVWVDTETDLDCMIVRSRLGALCGYVGVPDGHPYHGKEYNDLDVDVHGGLTFAADSHETDDQSQFVCHIPQDGRPENIWWLGFDCAHSQDIVPQMIATERKLYEKAETEGDDEGMRLWSSRSRIGWNEEYRSIDYVIREVERLARQCKEAK